MAKGKIQGIKLWNKFKVDFQIHNFPFHPVKPISRSSERFNKARRQKLRPKICCPFGNLSIIDFTFTAQWDILGLISSSFGAQKKCGNLKKRPHFDHINVVKMWSFYFSGSFRAHFGLKKMWSKCGDNVVKMWSFSGMKI